MVEQICSDKRTTQKQPTACYVIGAALIMYLLLSVLVILIVHMNLVGVVSKSSLLRTHVICAGFGMLGASMAAIRKYYSALISETNSISKNNEAMLTNWSLGWQYYYLTRPILGGILGALSYLLSYIGFQILANPADIQISNEGRYLLFGLAFLSGFSVSHVLARLEKIAIQTFKSSSTSVNDG